MNFVLKAEIWAHLWAFDGLNWGPKLSKKDRFSTYISASRMKFKNRLGTPESIHMRGLSLYMTQHFLSPSCKNSIENGNQRRNFPDGGILKRSSTFRTERRDYELETFDPHHDRMILDEND